MNYLLDTQIFIWLATTPDKISAPAKSIIFAPNTNLLLSTASVWEMQIKAMLGKLSVGDSVEEFVLFQRYLSQVQPLAILEVHVWVLAQLPHHHKDPFDRILIAQAKHEEFTLISADSVFEKYDVQLVA